MSVGDWAAVSTLLSWSDQPCDAALSSPKQSQPAASAASSIATMAQGKDQPAQGALWQ